MMNQKEFFHLCSDGNRSPDFIISKKDFVAAMNILALCAANTEAEVAAFTIEDTHLHILLYSTRQECVKFKKMFEATFIRYAARNRNGLGSFRLEIEIFETAGDEEYLRNLAAYIVIQPTKDGKGILPFDYEWGSGSLYFRSGRIPLVWLCGEDGTIHTPIRFGLMSLDAKREIIHSRSYTIPANWSVCNGIVLPTNYVNVTMFENVFKSHNRYRVFLSNNSARDAEIMKRMAYERGVILDDLEAREKCSAECKALYGIRDPRRLASSDRIALAQVLRRKDRMTIRQIAKLIRLPESEVARYVS